MACGSAAEPQPMLEAPPLEGGGSEFTDGTRRGGGDVLEAEAARGVVTILDS